MPGLFWWLLIPLVIEYIIPVPLMLSIIIGWVAYGLQKSSLRDDEVRTRSTMIAIAFFVMLTFISCWLFYMRIPVPLPYS